MRKLLLLLITFTLISCGKSKEELMLYDYQQKNARSLNFDIKDLDFKVLNIEKVKDVKAADSATYFKEQFAKYWQKNPDETLIDTLSFSYVKNILDESIAYKDTLIDLYNERVLNAIRRGDYYQELESERKYDQEMEEKQSLTKTLSEISILEYKYNNLSKNPDSILSTKYRASYSMKNPLLSDIKQTFDAYFYTDNAQERFIKKEDLNQK